MAAVLFHSLSPAFFEKVKLFGSDVIKESKKSAKSIKSRFLAGKIEIWFGERLYELENLHQEALVEFVVSQDLTACFLAVARILITSSFWFRFF